MKGLSLFLAAAALSVPAWAGTDIGVSVGISQPGFYGRIDMVPQRTVVVRQPIYMHVPPGHAKHWRKHCARYDACGRPVYFVQEDWYRKHYGVPPERGKGKGHDKRG